MELLYIGAMVLSPFLFNGGIIITWILGIGGLACVLYTYIGKKTGLIFDPGPMPSDPLERRIWLDKVWKHNGFPGCYIPTDPKEIEDLRNRTIH